jgi:hypothetical protein
MLRRGPSHGEPASNTECVTGGGGTVKVRA